MTNEENQQRLELSDDDAEAYASRREALFAAEQDLGRQLDVLDDQGTPDAQRLRTALREVRTALERHIREADAPDGLLAGILQAAPWFAARAEQLRREHGHLLDATDRLLESAQAEHDVAVLLAEARALGRQISEHRHRGTALLLDAYTLDVPAGD
jgi:hypothetical protein